MIDPSVIAAMRAAAEAAPENFALRAHLAGLLLQSGDFEAALAEAQRVLAVQPTQLEALRTAAEAARGAGQPELADGYARMLSAFGGAPSPPKDLSAPPIAGFPSEPIKASLTPDTAPLDWQHHAEGSDITLADVAGMEAVKERLHLSFLGPLKNPELRQLYGKSLRGGLLLYGPPGCGKTYLARAIAGEMGMQFLSIGLDDVLDMYVGNSEGNLHELFEQARRIQPCVLFFDEIDALGRKRSLNRGSYSGNVVNQMLAEMDGVGSQNDGVYVIAASNHPWDVDAALRRPGRLDRTLFVAPPDEPARRQIVEMNLRGRPNEGIDAGAIAKKTDGFSGADIAHIVESAAERAIADAIRSGQVRPIRQKDMWDALNEVKPSTRPWLETAKNYALFANDGGSYDDLIAYLKARRMV